MSRRFVGVEISKARRVRLVQYSQMSLTNLLHNGEFLYSYEFNTFTKTLWTPPTPLVRRCCLCKVPKVGQRGAPEWTRINIKQMTRMKYERN